jgi:hypothetical protein
VGVGGKQVTPLGVKLCCLHEARTQVVSHQVPHRQAV